MCYHVWAMSEYVLAYLLDDDEPIEVARQPDRVVPHPDDIDCWVCGAAVVAVHCKIVCQNCGFTRDCSDP